MYDSGSDWASRLLSETSTFSMESSENIFTPTCFKSPPFSRIRPVAQRAHRSDGRRPKDGAGLGSPLIVEPGFLWWPDPLKFLREEIESSLPGSQLPVLLRRLAVLSDMKAALEDEEDLDNLPLGCDPEVPPELPRVREALQALQKDIEAETNRLSDEVLPRARTVARAAGWNFDTSVSKNQPFRLDLLSELAYSTQDVDFEFPLRCKKGLGLGVSPPLDACLHYPLKEETLHSGIDFCAWSSSYRSAEEMHTTVTRLLQEDIELGVIEGGFTWLELCKRLRLPASTPPPSPHLKSAQLIPGVAVTRLACIDETELDPEGNPLGEPKFRLVFDGTVAGVNPRVTLPVNVETPGLLDGESLLRYPAPASDPLLGIKIDVKSAFKRILLHPSEFPYALFSIAEKWFFSKSCPMGMRASPYHWCRLNGLILRLTKRLLQTYLHGSLMYVDDSLFAAQLSTFAQVFSVILIFLRLIGTPISFKKLAAGFLCDWVGFRLDFSRRRAYLSQARLDKLEIQMQDLLAQGLQSRVPLSSFRQLTYRMMWAAQSFPMSKSFLHAFFSILKSRDVQESGFVYSMKHLAPTFALWTSLIRAARVWNKTPLPRAPARMSITRTDAAAEAAGIFLGGWHAVDLESFAAGQISWFSLELKASFFPDSKTEFNLYISAAEALAVAIAVSLWGPDLVQSDSRVTVCGSDKWYSPSENLSAALQLLVKSCMHQSLQLQLSWVSGKENALADALSRWATDPSVRSELSWLPAGGRADCEVLFRVLPELKPYIVELEL